MQNRVYLLTCVVGFVLVGLLSCATTPPVQRRWGTVVDENNKAQANGPSTTLDEPELWIGAYASDSSPLSIKDLPDHAAASYIDVLGKLPNLTLDTLRSGVAKSISPPKPLLDTTALDRTLVITVTKRGFHPADRLVRTEIEIAPELNFRFADFVAAATAYSSINIETLGATRTTSSGVEIDPKLPVAILGSAKLTAGTSNSYTDQASVSAQIEQLTVYKRDQNLVVYRESERGIDLTGSTLVKLSLKSCKGAFDEQWVVADLKLFDDHGKPVAADQASITLKPARFTHANPFKVKATLHYILRHVLSGQETYSENDDKVQFISGTVSQEFTLVNASNLEVHRWQLQHDGPIQLIGVAGPFGHAVPFSFIDLDDAHTLERWIEMTGAKSIGPYTLVGADGNALPPRVSLDVQDSNGAGLSPVVCQ
jgi:hypothetical protein